MTKSYLGNKIHYKVELFFFVEFGFFKTPNFGRIKKHVHRGKRQNHLGLKLMKI